jgi:hypothetical protein
MARSDRTDKVADSQSTIDEETQAAEPTVLGPDETAEDRPMDEAMTVKTSGDAVTIGGNQTDEERALAATPRTGPLPGDPTEANPAHPSSLRVRSDGALVQKGTRRGEPSTDMTQPPGFESGEPDPRAVPSHPSKLEPDPTGVSSFRMIDAAAARPDAVAEAAQQQEQARGYSIDRATRSRGYSIDAATRPRGNTWTKAGTTVRYTGAEAMTVIVPEGASGGYDDLTTQGETLSFRPGQALPVSDEASAWLLKHPRFNFEKVEQD